MALSTPGRSRSSPTDLCSDSSSFKWAASVSSLPRPQRSCSGMKGNVKSHQFQHHHAFTSDCWGGKVEKSSASSFVLCCCCANEQRGSPSNHEVAGLIPAATSVPNVDRESFILSVFPSNCFWLGMKRTFPKNIYAPFLYYQRFWNQNLRNKGNCVWILEGFAPHLLKMGQTLKEDKVWKDESVTKCLVKDRSQ